MKCTDPNRAKYTNSPCPCPAHSRKGEGHFLGCDTHGCEATRCADARAIASWAKERGWSAP